MKTGAELIMSERYRHTQVEGWTPEHDDRYVHGELRLAAAGYGRNAVAAGTPAPATWPWDFQWWKPSDDPVRNLTKAGALIAAEIDRLQRLVTLDIGKGRAAV